MSDSTPDDGKTATTATCAACGGVHYGSRECPYRCARCGNNIEPCNEDGCPRNARWKAEVDTASPNNLEPSPKHQLCAALGLHLQSTDAAVLEEVKRLKASQHRSFHDMTLAELQREQGAISAAVYAKLGGAGSVTINTLTGKEVREPGAA